MRKRTELLAPAGNMECLQAAIKNGADAVYFAGHRFGARSYADNFDDDAVLRAVEYCHLHGAAAYVTVNTTVFDRELNQLEDFIRRLADARVNGVIVQDLGVLRTIRAICPGLPLHGSTQMTVHNLEGVLAAEKLGMRRVVLSRELSFQEMEYILAHCHAEIEVFVHGAMCMSYSGQCLMSSVLGGRSGNRGRCAQPCRLSYDGKGGKGYYLSLKDMSLVAHCRALADSGIASLKIEGRMKGPEYVAAVVRTYRDCLDGRRKPTTEEIERLNRVFYRGGLTDGYFVGQIGKKMFAFDKPDNPYARMDKEIIAEEKEKKISLSAKVLVRMGKPALLFMQAEKFSLEVMGDTAAVPARQHALTEEEIKRQLMKTGGTPFVFSKMEVTSEQGVFLPVKSLNDLRRKALLAAEQKILDGYPKWTCGVYTPLHEKKRQDFLGYTCAVRTEEQFWAVAEFDFQYLYLPMEILAEHPEKFQKEAERIVILPPVIQKDESLPEMQKILSRLLVAGFRRLAVENIGGFFDQDFVLHGGHRLNLMNGRALEECREVGLSLVCLSPELSLAQLRDVEKCLPTECIVYGHLPLMITENCILKNTGDCPCKAGVGSLKDRKGMTFPVVRDGKSCRSVVLNPLPTYMGDKKEELKRAGVAYHRLWFTIETADRCREICRNFFLNIPCEIKEYTRLHFYKGCSKWM